MPAAFTSTCRRYTANLWYVVRATPSGSHVAAQYFMVGDTLSVAYSRGLATAEVTPVTGDTQAMANQSAVASAEVRGHEALS